MRIKNSCSLKKEKKGCTGKIITAEKAENETKRDIFGKNFLNIFHENQELIYLFLKKQLHLKHKNQMLFSAKRQRTSMKFLK